MTPRRKWPATVKGRERLRTAVILAAAAAAGDGITLVAYPAPIISRDHAVPRLLGRTVEEAQKELDAGGFKPRVDGEESDPVMPSGRIVWQDPPPETAMGRGAVVHLTSSSGPAPVTIPDVLSFEMDQARQVVEAAGLAIGGVDTISSPAPAGIIVATRPGVGLSRPPGSAVVLVVSKGPADIRIPDLLGLKQEEARQRLEAAGLHVGTITTRAGGRKTSGTVLEQRPAAGVMSPHEGRVNLVIAT